MSRLRRRPSLATDFETAKPRKHRHDPLTGLGTHGRVECDGTYARAVDDSNLELELASGFQDLDASLEFACSCFDASVGRHESGGPSSPSGPACTFLKRCSKKPCILWRHAEPLGQHLVAYGGSSRSNLRDVPVEGLDPSDSKRGRRFTRVHVVRPSVARTQRKKLAWFERLQRRRPGFSSHAGHQQTRKHHAIAQSGAHRR
jgi:hypothetical protein